MPFRLDEFRAKIQFTTFARMPHLIYRACHATDTVSNTVYIQRAVCEALARDLDIPLQDLLDLCPEPRSRAKHVWHETDPGLPIHKVQSGGRRRIGPANTIEEVR